MAKAMDIRISSDLKAFTDCMYFMNGNCKLNDKCRYRHCREAAAQTNNCFKWPKTCRDVKCPYRHPTLPHNPGEKKKKPFPESTNLNPISAQASVPQEGFISFFWDIENVPIPKAQKPFDIVQRIRQKLVISTGLREYNFTCYCNSTMISQENQLNLFHANVRIVHVPDRKPNAVDRQIMLELDRFERAHRPPATIVLISGDIDFVGKLSDLRHQAGFHVIVIHNKPAKTELKATVNAHYPWELFTQAPTEASALETSINALNMRAPRQNRMNNPKNDGNLHSVEPSPSRTNPTVKPRSASAKKQKHHCPKCTNEFDTVIALRQHQEAKDHLFDCPVCDESFTTLDGQTQHQKSKGHQSGGYVCFGCNRQFTKFDGLNQHQQATGHNGFVGQGSPEVDRLFLPRSNNQTNGGIVQDPAALIMQQGIQALVQHLPHIFGQKK
jgi:meiosis arrest female protein 1